MTSIATTKTTKPKKKTKKQIKLEKQQKMDEALLKINSDELITENIKLYFGNCLEKMKLIPNDSVDLVLCDLPYGTTKCKWDTVIDISKLWDEYKRILKKIYSDFKKKISTRI